MLSATTTIGSLSLGPSDDVAQLPAALGIDRWSPLPSQARITAAAPAPTTGRPHLEIEQSVGALGDRGPRARLFEPEERSSWAIEDTRVRLGLADERIRLETHHTRSRHGRVPPGGLMDGSVGRLQVAGATSHRIEADVFEHGWLESSFFAAYRQADEEFDWAASPKRRKSFVAPGRQLFRGGGNLRIGPAVLTVSRSLETSSLAGAGHGLVHETTQGGLALALPDRWPEQFGWLSPTSAWLSFAEGSLQAGDEGTSDPTRTRDLGFGLSWERGRSSASASFWSSEHETERSRADWRGSGVDAGYGFYAERWGIFAGLTTLRSHSEGVLESSLDGSLSLFLYPGQLPPLSASLDLNHWESRYGSGESFSARTHGLELGVDLSRRLQQEFPLFEPRLQACYRLQHATGFAASSGFGHTIAFSVDLSF